MHSEEHINLCDESIQCLLQKFQEEISELKIAAQAEAKGSELHMQLSEAIVQSNELYNELSQVYTMYLEAQKDNRRHFTREEESALRYFGFAIPVDGRPPAAAPNTAQIQLPSRRALSAKREGSAENETETDVIDAVLSLRSFQRETTPDVTTPRLRGSSESTTHKSPSQHEMQHSPALYQQPFRVNGNTSGGPRIDRQMEDSLGLSRQKTLLRESTAMEWDQERREMQLQFEEKLLQVQQQLMDNKSAASNLRQELLEAAANREQTMNDRISKLEAELRDERVKASELACDHSKVLSALSDTLQKEQHMSASLVQQLTQARAELRDSLQTQEKLWGEIEALGAQDRKHLATMISELKRTTAETVSEERKMLIHQNDELREALRKSTSLHRQSASPRRVDTNDEVPQRAVSTFERICSESNETFAYNLGSCPDADAIDHAVTALLNSLRFPFVVAIRRIGRGGDYFIDRRVHIRLINGHVMVRPRQPSSSSTMPSEYEHLVQYLLQLYAPALELDTVLGEQHSQGGGSALEGGLAALTREKEKLEQSVREQEELLQRHRATTLVGRGLSPSPEMKCDQPTDSVKQRGWRRPPSPSPLPQNSTSTGDSVNQWLKMGQQERLEQMNSTGVNAASRQLVSSRSSSGAAQAKPVGKTMDLSQLTSDELEQLKRAALAQQVREMRKLNESKGQNRRH